MSVGADASVPELLGLRKHSTRSGSALGLMSDVEKGLPLSALDRIVHAVAPDDSSFAYRLVPRATLARRRGQHTPRLTAEESPRRPARLGLGIRHGRMEDRRSSAALAVSSAYDAGGPSPDRCRAGQRIRAAAR